MFSLLFMYVQPRISDLDLSVSMQYLCLLGVSMLYLSISWASPMRATPVQFLFGMRVVDTSGETLSFRRALVRSAALVGLIGPIITAFANPSDAYSGIVLLLGLSLLFPAALTPNRQAAHDFLAQSIVVNKIALKSPESREQLREHVSDKDPATLWHRTPSVVSIIGNIVVLGVAVSILLLMVSDR